MRSLALAAVLSAGLLGLNSLAEAKVEVDVGILETAVAAHRELKELTREGASRLWAPTNNNLGRVLRAIVQLESGAAKTGQSSGTTPQQPDTTSRAPKTASAYNDRGIAYIKKGDLDRAIADFDKAIELDPKLANAYNNRGTAYGMKGDLDRAFADLNKAIELDPKLAKAYNNRAMATSRRASRRKDCQTSRSRSS